jgi:large subunit ribosomal protein L10
MWLRAPDGKNRKGERMSEESKIKKQQVIDEIADKLERSSSLVIIDYIGITVAEADSMRNRLRDAGVDYKVYKNTLVKRAIAGTENEKLSEVLAGPSAFAFGYEDATAPARVLDSVIRDFKKMQFKAGIVDGVIYDAVGIDEIAKIPPRDELIAKFMGSIQSPLSKLVRTFAAIAEAGGGEEAAEAEAPAAAETAQEAADAPADEVVADAVDEVAETPAEADAPVEEVTAEAPAEEVAAEAAPAEEAADAPVEEAVAEAPAEETPEAPAEEAAPSEEKTEE